MDMKRIVSENWVELALVGGAAYWLFGTKSGKVWKDKGLAKIKEMCENQLSKADGAEPTEQNKEEMMKEIIAAEVKKALASAKTKTIKN